MSANPFGAVPLDRALKQSAEFVRLIFGRAGFRITRLVIAVEVEHARLDEPMCSAVSWPMNEMDRAADLARQARVIFQQGHAAQNVRGGDG